MLLLVPHKFNVTLRKATIKLVSTVQYSYSIGQRRVTVLFSLHPLATGREALIDATTSSQKL